MQGFYGIIAVEITPAGPNNLFDPGGSAQIHHQQLYIIPFTFTPVPASCAPLPITLDALWRDDNTKSDVVYVFQPTNVSTTKALPVEAIDTYST
jgi:hypothetical protein